MAIVSCPECSKKLKVADTSVGKKVKCSCGNVFVAESGNGAPVMAAAPVAAPDKVVVACTECGAKLKVASTSLGKKMKCPKCAEVFVAAAEEEAAPAPVVKKPARPAPVEDDEVDAPAPAKKGKAVSDDDMEDLFTFAQKDSGGVEAQEDESAFADEEDLPKPKGKGKSKKLDDDEDEDDFPKAKSKFGGKKAGKPSRMDDDDDAAGQKPVYPKRTLVNLFVFFLLMIFIAGFAVVFLEVVPTGLPKSKGVVGKPKKGEAGEEKRKKQEEAAAAENKKDAAKLEGIWFVDSAEIEGKPFERMIGDKFTFADGKLTAPQLDAAPFTLDAGKDPKEIDIQVAKFMMLGIYKFDGESLHFCTARPMKGPPGKVVPGPRPSKFESTQASLVVLKREKKKDNDKGTDKDKDKENPKDKGAKDDSKYDALESANSLKQIGLAIHNYHDTNNSLPPAASSGKNDKTAKPLLSWRVAILPYIEEGELYNAFDHDKPWDDPKNMKLIARMPKLYMIPGVAAKEGMTHYRTLVGPGTLLNPIEKAGKLIAKFKLPGVPDRTSNVIMVVEATEPTIWTKPDDLPYDLKGPLPKFGVVPAGFNALFADASVKFISAKVPDEVLRPYLTCENGRPRAPLDDAKGKGKGKDFDKDEPKSKPKDEEKKDPEGETSPISTEQGLVRPTWELPKGWKETKGNSFTVGAFAVEDKDRKVTVTVSVLTGKGGGLLANANRWRAQLKLPAWSEDELAKAAKKRKVDGVEGSYLELADAKSEQPASLLGVIVFREKEAWFFKLTGDAQLATREKENFLRFVDSVKFK